MNITIYSTADCSECRVLKSWLDKQDITYTSKITDEDDGAMAEFMSVNDGMISVPLTVVTMDDGSQHKMTGFNPAKFKALLPA
jgi:arsenate reductase-like glutaredoxin family protein